jgi:3-deoxy-manno-octulosonate cytidylyltransferase (CMP-KDO synthetase)
MSTATVIPARMGSSRFPGKPLAPILGRSMIEHVYRRCEMCPRAGEVYVATCDSEIGDAVERFGGRYIMTAPTHQRASDRVAEAAERLAAEIVVMVQGDEPLLHPDMIDLAIAPLLADQSVGCVNLMSPIVDLAEFQDPNTIKVVVDRDGFARYFSRAPIPTQTRQGGQAPTLARKQVCVIPFRRDALADFVSLPPTSLEEAESIDMLRFLEHGRRVRMVESPFLTHSVDTPDDLARVEAIMQQDPLLARYA